MGDNQFAQLLNESASFSSIVPQAGGLPFVEGKLKIRGMQTLDNPWGA